MPDKHIPVPASFLSDIPSGGSMFSPAPWKGDGRGNGAQELVIRNAQGEEIACVRGAGRLGDVLLIAAAPELAEALQGILLALCQNATFPADVQYARNIARAVLDRAGVPHV